MYAFPLPAENKKSILIDTINNTASFFIITDLRVRLYVSGMRGKACFCVLHLALVMLR